MNARSVIETSLRTSLGVLTAYLEDLSEEELFVRPTENAKHTAWQLGHLIVSENQIINAVKPGSAPKLPEGFAAAYSRDNAEKNSAADFHSKSQYQELMKLNREALIAMLHQLTDAELDQPAPEPIRRIAPTNADAILMMGNHGLMHSGQIAVVRRKLNKPVVI